MASTALISGEFLAQPGQSDPSQLQAVFQGYGLLASATLPSPALTLSNGDGLSKTYFKLLATLTDGSVLYGFQADDPIAVAFIGTIIIKYAGQVIATFPQTPDLANIVQINGVGPVDTTVVSQFAIGGSVAASPTAALDGDTVEIDAYYAQSPPSFNIEVDSTGWTQFVLTVKSNPRLDLDGAALLSVVVSNPAAGTDGLQLINGAAPSGGATAADASLAVIQASPTTIVQPTLSAYAAAIPSGTQATWELSRYSGGASTKYVCGTGPFFSRDRVRRNPLQS